MKTMPTALPFDQFFNETGVILDVRSPSEFTQGHIPSSISLPLFSDEERAIIGTTYKQQGQTLAIEFGVKLMGPKLFDLFTQAKAHLNSQPAKIVCWRGGMRSGFVARFLEGANIPCLTLQGGYKSFRRWTIRTLEQLSSKSLSLLVLGGFTGSGKTEILKALRSLGEQVIDLEELSGHRGSVFGHIGCPVQCSQELFENRLAYHLYQYDLSKPIWIEDESRRIGQHVIPHSLYQKLKKAPLLYLQKNFEERCLYLEKHYGSPPLSLIRESIQRLSKHLGSQLTNQIFLLLDENKKREALSLILLYYDRTYQYQMMKRENVHMIKETFATPYDAAYYLLHYASTMRLCL